LGLLFPVFGDRVFHLTLLALLGIEATTLVLVWRIVTRRASPQEISAAADLGDSKIR
jgi:hypothetical protein